ncbi:MAG: Na+/H+ antiporter NhaC family protein, partial [Firmicutes bacterium]|nr:Na+/H+ antiporter NhaC family protein [Bacillota bacterium]
SIYYMVAKVINFKEITNSITQGFKAMAPAILILTFAWTIAGIMGAKGGYLDAQAFVDTHMAQIPATVQAFFPAIFFILAGLIAFSTGTSWGTFGVLVPIAVTILGGEGTLVFITVSATLGGAVFGDHVSPISDTTILASTGANCNHVDHVRTQLPYAALVASIAFFSYIVAGLLSANGGVVAGLAMWAVALVLFFGFVAVIKTKNKKAA